MCLLFTKHWLATQAKLIDQLAISIYIAAFQVIEQFPALTNHLKQSLTRVMIVRVYLEMFRELVDAFGQQRDLDFDRTGILVGTLKFLDY